MTLTNNQPISIVTELPTYSLNSQEQKRLEWACNDPMLQKLKTLEDIVKISQKLALALSQNFPNLNRAIQSLKSGKQGILIIKNLPQIAEPIRLETFLGNLLGNVAKYEGEGDYIIPIREQAKNIGDRPSFQNSREFYLHTDLSYAPKPPDFMALHSLVNPVERGGHSKFCDLKPIIPRLSQKTVEELQKSHFLFPAPSHYQGVSVVQFPILTRSQQHHWQIRFRRDNLKSLTRLGMDAVIELIELINQCSVEIHLEENSIIIINNQTVLHGRTAFIGSNDLSRPRCLNRLYLNLTEP